MLICQTTPARPPLGCGQEVIGQCQDGAGACAGALKHTLLACVHVGRIEQCMTHCEAQAPPCLQLQQAADAKFRTTPQRTNLTTAPRPPKPSASAATSPPLARASRRRAPRSRRGPTLSGRPAPRRRTRCWTRRPLSWRSCARSASASSSSHACLSWQVRAATSGAAPACFLACLSS